MALTTPKSHSVLEDGQPDGWTPTPGYLREMDPQGETRLVVSVPVERLLDVHARLAGVLSEPVGLLYRQVVDRRDPKPNGAPPRDFVVLELTQAALQDMLRKYTDLFHHDARCEVWLRGAHHEQVVLDADGMIYLYPDDPGFTDILASEGMNDDLQVTIMDRDYARHSYHAECDALEDDLIARYRMAEVPVRG